MRSAVVLVVLLISACGDDGGGTTDARIDASPADARVDAPPGTCPAGEVFFTGELLDWDWSLANAVGVNNAMLVVQGMPQRTDATAPNGRFELCIPPGRVLI